nr:hypothetical protein [Pseudobdellovibrionaceae bacterium]
PLDGEFYIGSADWMYRNLHARVEAVVPIWERPLKEKLWEILQLSLKDQRQAWDMKSDGSYSQRKSDDPGLHATMIQLTKNRNTVAEDATNDKDAPQVYGNLSRPARGRRRS